MGNNVVVFRLHSPSEAYTTTAAKINSSDIGYIAKYINEQNKSSDKKKEIEVFESLDYKPFMAKFRKYKPELTQVEKENILVRGLINLRANPHMREIMIKMFDYDLEVSDLEKEVFIVKEKIDPIFNFINVSLQLLDGPFDKAVALLNKKMGNSGTTTIKKLH